MRISDWSSDVCSSDLSVALIMRAQRYAEHTHVALVPAHDDVEAPAPAGYVIDRSHGLCRNQRMHNRNMNRSEEHTSELQSLMRISYAVFCLKKKKNRKPRHKRQMNQHQCNNSAPTTNH